MSVRLSNHRYFTMLLGCVLALGGSVSGCSSKKSSPSASSSVTNTKPTSAPAVCAPAVESAGVAAIPTTVPPPVVATNAPVEKRAEPSRPSKVLADGSSLKVKKLVLATDVKRPSREPEGVASSFKQGEFKKIYAYVEVANPGDESEILVTFEPPSDKPAAGQVKLAVGTSPRWRTWASSRSLDEKGEWTAVVTTTSGKELAREKFVIL